MTKKPKDCRLISIGVIVENTDGKFKIIFNNKAEAKKLQVGDGIVLIASTDAGFIQYAAARIRVDGSFTHEYVDCPKRALGYHDGHKSLGSTVLAVLSAQDKQLNWHELDRYEAKEKP